jgi:hypothetical protein
LSVNDISLIYEKLELQQKILEEILLDVLLKKEEISKKNSALNV